MAYAILGLTALVAIFAFGRWMLTAQPHEIRKALGYLLSAVLVAVAGFLFIRGAVWPALAVLTTAIPPLLRSSGWFPKGNPTAGQQSNVETAWLDMKLDHDSGDMDGDIKQGPFAGMRLSALDDQDLQDFYNQLLADDPESARLLGAWIERMRPHMTGNDTSAGHEQHQHQSTHRNSGMSRQDAMDILGLDGTPSDDEIQAAWRRMIARAHPDQGGSAWLAAQVNEARDVLLS